MAHNLGEHGLKGQYAGFVSRLLAYGLDIGIIVVMLIAFGWLWDTVTTLFPPVIVDLEGLFQIAIAGMVVVVTAALYYLFFWTLMGQTPGKMLLGLRIVSLDGSGLTFWQALRRFIGYFLSALVFYVGYLWVLVDNRRQGWHDKLAGTIVVYAWDARLGDLLSDRIQGSQEGPQEGPPLEGSEE